MPYTGMTRDWLALCYLGSISCFFGTLWLYKEMLMFAVACQFCCNATYTAAIVYLSYTQWFGGNRFWTYWYGTLCVF